MESGYATFGGGGTGTGSADDGWGDPVVNNTSNAAHYEVKDGSSGTITITSGNLSAKTPPFTSLAQASGAEVVASFSVTPIPITLSPSGGIGPNSAKSLLIGQQFGGSVNSGTLSQTSWNWTVSGGSPFLDYVAADGGAVYTPFTPPTGATMGCYFAKPTTSVTVSCAAHLALPSGAFPAAGLDVTVKRTLTIEKPSDQLNIVIGSVNAEPGLPFGTPPTFVELEQYPQTTPSPNACGIQFQGTITTPAAYVLSNDYGQWNWTQLVTTSRQEKNNGTYWQFAIKTNNSTTIINGRQVLDGGYPYGSWYSANGVQDGNTDSPVQDLSSDPAIREYDVSDSFDDYLMYQPPGANSLPVPLKETDWYWTFQALKNASNVWSVSGRNAYWGFVADFPAFPTWNLYAPDGCLTYVP
jgi:hypothetical protein